MPCKANPESQQHTITPLLKKYNVSVLHQVFCHLSYHNDSLEIQV